MTFKEFDEAYRKAQREPFWDPPTVKIFAVFAALILPIFFWMLIMSI